MIFLDNGTVAATGETEFFFGPDGPAAFRHYIGTEQT
jgi:thiamine transport system ATP-binding protein